MRYECMECGREVFEDELDDDELIAERGEEGKGTGMVLCPECDAELEDDEPPPPDDE